jgi:hypothetical protein
MTIDLWKDIVLPLGIGTVAGIVSAGVIGVWLYHKGQRDNAIDCLVGYIDSMTEKGIEYWNSAESDDRSKLLASQIKQLSARIGHNIEHIAKDYQSFRFENFHLLSLFRISITGGPFEVATREIDRIRQETVERRRTDLVRAIHRAKKLF